MPIILVGDEFGPYANTSELRLIVREFAREKFAGIIVNNAHTNRDIKITMVGVKHTVHKAWDDLLKTVFALPKIIESATPTSSLPDSKGRPFLIHKYQSEIILAGTTFQIGVIVREMKNGEINYYDHAIIKT